MYALRGGNGSVTRVRSWNDGVVKMLLPGIERVHKDSFQVGCIGRDLPREAYRHHLMLDLRIVREPPDDYLSIRVDEKLSFGTGSRKNKWKKKSTCNMRWTRSRSRRTDFSGILRVASVIRLMNAAVRSRVFCFVRRNMSRNASIKRIALRLESACPFCLLIVYGVTS